MAVWTSYVGLLLGWTQRPFGLMPCSGRTIIWFLRVTPIGNCNYLPARPYLILFFSSFLLYYCYYYHYFFYFIFLPFSRVRIISVPFGRQFIANVKGMVIVPFLWLVGCFFSIYRTLCLLHLVLAGKVQFLERVLHWFSEWMVEWVAQGGRPCTVYYESNIIPPESFIRLTGS